MSVAGENGSLRWAMEDARRLESGRRSPPEHPVLCALQLVKFLKLNWFLFNRQSGVSDQLAGCRLPSQWRHRENHESEGHGVGFEPYKLS